MMMMMMMMMDYDDDDDKLVADTPENKGQRKMKVV